MKWREEMVIPVNIEKVWHLFQLDQIKRIMNQVVDMKVIESVPGVVGSKYEQTYREGKREMTYIVTDLAHEDTPDRKYNESTFQLANMFDIKVNYTLEKISENETRFIYAGENRGLNFIGKVMMKLTPKKNNDKVVQDFMQRVYDEALKEQ